MSQNKLKSGAQKFVVRVIASELDRRSGSLERALADVRARMTALGGAQETLTAQLEAANDYIRRVHEHVGNIERAHGQLASLHHAVAAKVDVDHVTGEQTRADLHTLAVEFSALRESFARLDLLLQEAAGNSSD